MVSLLEGLTLHWLSVRSGVYKLCEIEGLPRIKLSEHVEKVTLPGRKEAYRLFNKDGLPVIDLLCKFGGEVPVVGQRILCKHPFDEVKRCYITPSKVELLQKMVWGPKTEGAASTVLCDVPSIADVRSFAAEQMDSLRPDHRRLLNPTPYKISVTAELHDHCPPRP